MLERYPEGSFVELAVARLESLREPETDSTETNGEVSEGELAIFGTASRTVEMGHLRAYLKKYPDGALTGAGAYKHRCRRAVDFLWVKLHR